MNELRLSDLGVIQLGVLLSSLNFNKLKMILQENEISGEMLNELTSEVELQLIDDRIKPFEAKGWFKEILKLKVRLPAPKKISLECPVCFQLYSDVDPTTLQCGHSLCIEDAQMITRCPLCETNVAAGHEFAVNYTIRNMALDVYLTFGMVPPSSAAPATSATEMMSIETTNSIKETTDADYKAANGKSTYDKTTMIAFYEKPAIGSADAVITNMYCYLATRSREPIGFYFSAAGEVETTVRKAILILNTLSVNSFDKMSDEFIKLGLLKSPQLMARAVDLIVTKAQMEERFCSRYADLCSKIVNQCSAILKVEDVEDSRYLGDVFLSKLLVRCRMEANSDHMQELKSIRNNTVLSAEEKEVKEVLLMKRYTGHVRFIGELYVRDLIHPFTMRACVDSMIAFYKNSTIGAADAPLVDIYCHFAAKLREPISFNVSTVIEITSNDGILRMPSGNKFRKLLNEFVALDQLETPQLITRAVDSIIRFAQREEFCFVCADLCNKIINHGSCGPRTKGEIFRAHLLERCQMEFESDRRSTGTVRFIGELYNKDLISANVICGCLNILKTKTEAYELICMAVLFQTVSKKLGSFYAAKAKASKTLDKRAKYETVMSEYLVDITLLAEVHHSSLVRALMKSLLASADKVSERTVDSSQSAGLASAKIEKKEVWTFF